MNGRAGWLRSFVAVAALSTGCSKPPPPLALSPVGQSQPVIAVVVAAQATLWQAKYGCTVAGCGPGYACDHKTRLCKSLQESDPTKPNTTAPSNSEPEPKGCVGSSDGLISLCLLSPAESNRLQIRAQNVGPKTVALSLRELRVSKVLPCAKTSPDELVANQAPPAAVPVAKPLGLRFSASVSDPSTEPRNALFLSPGPGVDIDVSFEIQGTSECGVAIDALFEVARQVLKLAASLPPTQPR